MSFIYAVDFDGTLCENRWPEIGPPNKRLIDYLVWTKNKNKDKIILWTMREGEKLNQAIDWCEKFGLTFDTVNENVKEIIEKFGTNPRKVWADFYIDDHNCRIIEQISDVLPYIDANWEPFGKKLTEWKDVKKCQEKSKIGENVEAIGS